MDATRKPRVIKKKVTKDLPPPEVNETDPLPMEAFTDKKPKFAELVKRNLDSINSVSLKERTENFINETSFTAIARIVKANTIVKKILWLILVLAMMSWLGIQCYWLFDKYFSYPVEVKIELKSAPKLAFPSVTVCNRNPLKKSKLRDSVFSGLTQMFDLKTDDTLYNGAMDRLRDQSPDHGGPDPHTNSSNLTALVQEYGFNMWDGLQNDSVRTAFYQTSSSEINAGIAYASAALLEDDDVIEEFGHQKMDMITSCVFAGNLCSPENFTYLHNSKYGNCYTFNSIKDPNPPLYTYYAGPLMGMTLEFNIQQDEYISALAPDAGIRVSIHERGTYPFPEDDGFTIAPGMATSVALKRVYISRLEPQHGNCSSNPTNVDEYMKRYEFSYHRRTCLKSCYQQKLIDYCDCACSNFIVPKNVTNICNYDNESIRICTMETIKTWDTCEEKCPSTCQENKYETMVTASAWPSEAYEDYLESRMKLTTSEYMSGGQKTKMDNNLVKLEIFFAEMTYESIESQKAYEVYISRLEPQHGNCSSNPTNVDEYMKRYEFSYHRRTCLKSCYQQKLIDYCDCACSNFFVSKNVTNICNYDNENIKICTMETIKTWDTCEEKCPSTCQGNKYETMVTASAWPSEAYEVRQLESRMKLTTSEYMSGGQKTKMDNNLVKLEIFFAEMTYESIESQKAYESQNLISDVGGQLGLWLGLSAITVGEIFEFAMSVFRLCTAKFFSKRHRTTDSTPITTFKSDAS